MSTFRGIELFCREVPADSLVVDKPTARDDRLFFTIGQGVVLNRRQVQELVNRLNEWLGESDGDGDLKEWEDLP